MEKQFESISELVKDEQFVKFVHDGFAEITMKRRNSPEPKPGFRYVRDWYDRMEKLNVKAKNIETYTGIDKSTLSTLINGNRELMMKT